MLCNKTQAVYFHSHKFNSFNCCFTHPQTFYLDSIIVVRDLVMILYIWDTVTSLHQLALSHCLDQLHFVRSFNEGGIKLSGNAWKSLCKVKKEDIATWLFLEPVVLIIMDILMHSDCTFTLFFPSILTRCPFGSDTFACVYNGLVRGLGVVCFQRWCSDTLAHFGFAVTVLNDLNLPQTFIQHHTVHTDPGRLTAGAQSAGRGTAHGVWGWWWWWIQTSHL